MLHEVLFEHFSDMCVQLFQSDCTISPIHCVSCVCKLQINEHHDDDDDDQV